MTPPTRSATERRREQDPAGPPVAPGTIHLNGEPQPWRGGLVLAELLRGMGIDPDPESGRRGVAVALDGRVVPRAAWAETVLAAGARVEVIGAIGGG